MNRNMPSLKAVRFFEAAARHLSFTRAGEELFVTQGAVSKQIKQLEEQLGCQLFARNGPNLRLTREGEIFLHTVARALDTIRQGVGELRREAESTLRVSILPSFASNWLIPRLPLLEKKAPNLSLDLLTSYKRVDFSIRTDIDVAFRMGDGNWPDLHTLQLTRDRMFPVCSPDMAVNFPTIEDLNSATLLTEEAPYNEWERWFTHVNVPYEVKKSRVYEDTNSQLWAAKTGQGICLAREEMVEEQLDSGELVRLFDVDYRSNIHYFFVCPAERLENTHVRALHDWLLEITSREYSSGINRADF